MTDRAALGTSSSETRFDPLDLDRDRLNVPVTHLSEPEFGSLSLFDRRNGMGVGALESYGMEFRLCEELPARARYMTTPLDRVPMPEGNRDGDHDDVYERRHRRTG